MAHRHQRGWLKKEKRRQGETWVLFFRTIRKSDGKRVENKIPIGLVKDFPEKSCAWAEVERQHLHINQVDFHRCITFSWIPTRLCSSANTPAAVSALATSSQLFQRCCQRRPMPRLMMRISREEEHFIGRARPGFQGRMKIGFSKDGKITAVDMFAICNNGPYDAVGDVGASGLVVSLLYQPPAMRWRGVTVLTNTPPRGPQSAPGGMQGIIMMEPILAKAARKLSVDQVDIRRVNAPEGKAPWGPERDGKRAHSTSAFLKEAFDRGVEQFKWKERIAQPKRSGTKVRGVGVSSSAFFAGSTGYDGLIVIKPDGRIAIQSGIGNLGTESISDVHRVVAEVLGVPWEKCDVTWGNTSQNLPWTCVSGGSQTTHAMTRAAYAVAMDGKQKLQEIAAKTHGGKPEQYDVANERVFRKGGGATMTLAQAAQRAIQLGGIYDGHQAPEDVNKYTKASIAALAGQGVVAAAKDKYPHDGQSFSYVRVLLKSRSISKPANTTLRTFSPLLTWAR